MTIPFAAITNWSGSPPFAIFVIVFLIGIILFFVGFRTYREYRLLEDTPIAPVRSIPMGLVHVRGKATGGDRLTSPLTGVPCYYYRVQVEKYVKKEKSSEWETVRTDSEERNFLLDDGTAKVLVNPHQAEYDVLRTFQAESGGVVDLTRFVEPSLGVPGPSDQDLRAYLNDNSKAIAALNSLNVPGAQAAGKVLGMTQKLGSMGISLSGGGVNLSFGDTQRYRFTEHCLLAERDCNVLGTCAENPAPKDEHDRNVIMKGQNEKTFLVTNKSEGQIEKSLGRKAFLMIFLGAVLMIGAVAYGLHTRGML
ncbi:MAG TPA: GIDE domain-containing protein [Terriglobia bacterium]|nr:GIDE domain-containing protein [Terriglobia bacterium]